MAPSGSGKEWWKKARSMANRRLIPREYVQVVKKSLEQHGSLPALPDQSST